MKVRAVIVGAVVALILPGCGDEESGGAAAGGRDEVTVFAASSLTSAFEDLGRRLEAEDPGVDVKFNFLSSSDLAAQIEQGSPADVFASADETNMQRVQDGDFAGDDPAIFAHNKLEVIVPPDNPGAVNSVKDLARDDLVVSLCNEECPAGRYALEMFDNAGIDVRADSLETEVKGVVTRVSLGEADAGIAYATDTTAAGGDVDGIPIPDDVNVIATYPIVALKDSPETARRFVDLVLSEQGQAVLGEYGFLPK
jgi:molybdate transport system substrate-binding protein